MEAVNIYGHIPDLINGTEIVIGVGNYNNVHGLACYYPADDLFQIRPIAEIMTPSVIPFILRYERSINGISSDKIYFSLEVKNNDITTTPKYVNIDIGIDEDRKVACAIISPEKGIFTIDYSSVDKTPRSNLLAGTLYSLKTTFGEQEYIVSWKINGFSNGDLINFLPASWYENVNGVCQPATGINNLVNRLNQLKFKGYTTEQWCETAPQIINCHENNLCGDCFGQCLNSNHICWPDGNKFICGLPQYEPDMINTNLVTFADPVSSPQTTGTVATWVAIIVVFVVVAVLAWGLTHKYYKTL